MSVFQAFFVFVGGGLLITVGSYNAVRGMTNGMQGFNSNFNSELVIAGSTSIATEIGLGNLWSIRPSKSSRMSYCYKSREI